MRHLIDILDFSTEELQALMEKAIDIEKHPASYSEACKGKKLATLFYEPSTRTRLSFEAAMLELGGSVIGFSGAQNSSASKGESVADTAKVVSNYADIIATRTTLEGAPFVAALNSTIPVINAGDGSHFHPTQTLADLLTIYKEKGKLENLTIGYCGDLKYGRTVHSLINALARYPRIKTYLISPKELMVPDYVKKEALTLIQETAETIVDEDSIFVETTSLEEALPKLDILYMTRVQRERFDDPEVYERLKDGYILTMEKLNLGKSDTSVLHPLPRVNEISVAVDDDPRACYFQQTLNGKLMRAALILKLLEEAEKDGSPLTVPKDAVTVEVNATGYTRQCTNPKCISSTEQELKPLFKETEEGYRCIYCDAELQ